MMHSNVEKLINDFAEILDRDPMDQMEDTQSILRKFTHLLALELGEIVVASPYMEGTRMYFDEKIARYEIKKSVGIEQN
jgi:ATP phosphoribosyltransferase